MASMVLVVRKKSQQVIGLIGLVLILVGVLLDWWPNKPRPHLATVSISVGSSLLAAALATYLSLVGEAVYERLITLGISDFFPSRQDVPPTNWVDWLEPAERHVTLLGVTHGGWCRDDRLGGAVRALVTRAVPVKIFFLDPNGRAAEIRKREDGGRDTHGRLKESIEIMWNIRQGLPVGSRDLLKLYVYEATPSCGLAWIDERMVVTHYLAGVPNRTSPVLMVGPAKLGKKASNLYDTYARNAQVIEASFSTELNEGNIQRFLPSKG